MYDDFIESADEQLIKIENILDLRIIFSKSLEIIYFLYFILFFNIFIKTKKLFGNSNYEVFVI